MNFDFSNILMRAAQITWRHKTLWVFHAVPLLFAFLILLLIAAPVFVLVGNDGEISNTLGLVLAIGIPVFALLLSLVNIVISSFTMSASTAGIVRAERGADSFSIPELIESGKRYFPRILGVLLAINLTLGLFFTVFFLLMFALILVTMGIASICMQPIMLLLSPLSFLMVAVMEAAQMAVVAEDATVMDALKRGWDVVKTNIWKYLILILIVYLGTTFLTSFLMMPLMLPMMALPFFAASSPDRLDVNSIMALTACFTCFFFPVMATFQSVIGVFMKSSLCLAYLRLTVPKPEEAIPLPSGD